MIVTPIPVWVVMTLSSVDPVTAWGSIPRGDRAPLELLDHWLGRGGVLTQGVDEDHRLGSPTQYLQQWYSRGQVGTPRRIGRVGVPGP